MPIVRSPEIWHRDDFPLLCNWRKLWRAVEIGVDRGEYSALFLSRWLGELYIGLDPYTAFHDLPGCREADFAAACIRYERHARVARLLRSGSVQFAARIASLTSDLDFLGFFAASEKEKRNTTVDFAYIDGNHDYECVCADILAWWPLLSAGGILAGHDFDNRWGVERAVNEMFINGTLDGKEHTVYLTDDWPQSWYVYRNGIPGPEWVRHPG